MVKISSFPQPTANWTGRTPRTTTEAFREYQTPAIERHSTWLLVVGPAAVLLTCALAACFTQ